jgi:hypothetical protein
MWQYVLRFIFVCDLFTDSPSYLQIPTATSFQISVYPFSQYMWYLGQDWKTEPNEYKCRLCVTAKPTGSMLGWVHHWLHCNRLPQPNPAVLVRGFHNWISLRSCIRPVYHKFSNVLHTNLPGHCDMYPAGTPVYRRHFGRRVCPVPRVMSLVATMTSTAPSETVSEWPKQAAVTLRDSLGLQTHPTKLLQAVHSSSKYTFPIHLSPVTCTAWLQTGLGLVIGFIGLFDTLRDFMTTL